jgi:hypothetical protein
LIERVTKGHGNRIVRLASLICLLKTSAHTLPQICKELHEAGRASRMAELAMDIGDLRQRRRVTHEFSVGKAAKRASATLPPLLQEISDASYALANNAIPSLSDGARDLLVKPLSPSEEVRVFRVALDEHFPMSVSNDVQWLLQNGGEASHALVAIEGAIRHDMKDEIETGLSHRFAQVVAASLTALAGKLDAPLPPRFLVLSSHKGSPVRRALVELLEAKVHNDYLAALLRLSKDDWSPRSRYVGEEDDYPIAQVAVKAIGKLGPLDDEVANVLYRQAIGTRDSDVRSKIFALLVRSAGIDFQSQLFELATNPGRRTIRQAAVVALLVGEEHVSSEIVSRITPRIIEAKAEYVALRLLLLLVLRGEIEDIIAAGVALSTNENRRVMLVPLIWILRERDLSAAERIARLLPSHPAAAWALAGGQGKLDETSLDKLGDPASVQLVVRIMCT